MFNDKLSYYGFKVGQTVKLTESVWPQEMKVAHPIGHEFIIKSFPCCVTVGRYQYFVYGKDRQNNTVRCFINQIVK